MKKGLTSTGISLLAAAFMTLDHIALLFAKGTAIFYPMRAVGRISFPLFIFLLTEGIEKTSSKPRYLARLAVFAALSEIPFDMAFYGKPFYFDHQNTIFTLLISACALTVMQKFGPKSAAGLLATAPFVLLAELTEADGGGMGVLLAVMLFCADSMPRRVAALAMFSVCMNLIYDKTLLFGLYSWGMAALIFIELYNGRRGGGARFGFIRKWCFYAYYPAHLMALAALTSRITSHILTSF